MKNILGIFLASMLVLVAFSGCSSNRAYSTWFSKPGVDNTINESIVHMSDQLLATNRIKNGEKIAITSFVELHQLNKTTYFGRKLAESFYSELHKRGFVIIDTRGTKTIRINADGEFFITRDVKLLDKKRIENTYILVGTYTKFGDGIMLNARIIDNVSGEVVSAGRTIMNISGCDLFENCNEPAMQKPALLPAKAKVKSKEKPVVKIRAKHQMKSQSRSKAKQKANSKQKRTIGISDAGCTYTNCPKTDKLKSEPIKNKKVANIKTKAPKKCGSGTKGAKKCGK